MPKKLSPDEFLWGPCKHHGDWVPHYPSGECKLCRQERDARRRPRRLPYQFLINRRLAHGQYSGEHYQYPNWEPVLDWLDDWHRENPGHEPWYPPSLPPQRRDVDEWMSSWGRALLRGTPKAQRILREPPSGIRVAAHARESARARTTLPQPPASALHTRLGYRSRRHRP